MRIDWMMLVTLLEGVFGGVACIVVAVHYLPEDSAGLLLIAGVLMIAWSLHALVVDPIQDWREGRRERGEKP